MNKAPPEMLPPPCPLSSLTISSTITPIYINCNWNLVLATSAIPNSYKPYFTLKRDKPGKIFSWLPLVLVTFPSKILSSFEFIIDCFWIDCLLHNMEFWLASKFSILIEIWQFYWCVCTMTVVGAVAKIFLLWIKMLFVYSQKRLASGDVVCVALTDKAKRFMQHFESPSFKLFSFKQRKRNKIMILLWYNIGKVYFSDKYWDL